MWTEQKRWPVLNTTKLLEPEWSVLASFFTKLPVVVFITIGMPDCLASPRDKILSKRHHETTFFPFPVK